MPHGSTTFAIPTQPAEEDASEPGREPNVAPRPSFSLGVGALRLKLFRCWSTISCGIITLFEEAAKSRMKKRPLWMHDHGPPLFDPSIYKTETTKNKGD